MARKILTATKLEWYEKLGFGIAKGEPDANTVGINHTDGYGGALTEESVRGRKARDELGEFANLPAHVTIHRSLWTRKFRPSDDIEVIMERIFGKGQLSAHVTLEETGAERAPRCFWKGQNYGRTPAEVKLLNDMLSYYVLRARDIIVDLQARYDEFVWPDSDKPLEALSWDPSDLFAEIAALASRKTGARVVVPAQKDSALLWASAAIHPMQALQNTYQRLVRDACRDIKDDDQKKAKEGEELGHYCYFEAAPPRLLAQPKDAEGGLEERLAKVEKDLAKLGQAVAEGVEQGAEIGAEARARAERALTNLLTVRSFYSNGEVVVPALSAADRWMTGIDDEIKAAKGWPELEKVARRLGQAHREMTRVHGGLCCIQNFHVIEPFYLFRLLVKFRIESDGPIAAAKRTEVSSVVTSLLHNNSNQIWLFNWLRDKLIALNQSLMDACGDDVKFFLKGGRAAKYLVHLPTRGENDWDTQIVINPNLRAAQWYENFLKVHNIVLVFLQQAKAEFLIQCYTHVEAFARAVDDWRAKEAEAGEEETAEDLSSRIRDLLTDLEETGDSQAESAIRLSDERAADKEPALDVTKESCKAELIDIGIPRRDTVEAFDQWEHFVPDVFTVEGMPIPGHLYYIAEYVMMIRDAFADNSISLGKTPKRIIRLREVLVLPDLAPFVLRERGHIPPPVLPQSVPLVDGLPVAEKSVLTVMLKQFAEALDLDVDPGLARCFDDLFAGSVGARKAKAHYPDSLKSAIAAQDGYTAEHVELGDAIGYAQWVAETIGEHISGPRAKFMLEHRKVFGSFIKAIYTASIFSQEDGLEVQFAVTGSFAALLHAEYAGFERRDALDPLRRVDLKIYCQPDADPATVRELILPLVEQYLSHPQTVNFKLELHGEDSICLYWPADVAFGGDFTYTPLVLKITVQKCAEDWPQLAFVRGFPVLGLRDLIWEYKRHAGHVEEIFTQRKLKASTECLVDILTRFENPAAGTPWARPGIPGLAIGGPDPVPPREPPPVEEPPPDLIEVPDGADSLFAALVLGAAARGITGYTTQSLRAAVADELKDRGYARIVKGIIDELLQSLPQIDDSTAAVEGAGIRIGDPALQQCIGEMYRARQRDPQSTFRWFDEANAYQTALRGDRYLGGSWEASVAGGIFGRGVIIHQVDGPPTSACSLADDDPIRLLFDGEAHYDLYRSGFVPG